MTFDRNIDCKVLLQRIRPLDDAARRHLFVSDLDGTLLDNSARVSSLSAKILSELTYNGAMFSIATARTPATVDPIMAHVFTRIPMVVMTGAAMWNRVHRTFENVHYISAEATARAIGMCRARGLAPFIYTLDTPPGGSSMLHVFHNGPLTPKEEKFVYDRRGLALKRFHIDEPAGLAESFDNAPLILAMGPVEKVLATADSLRDDSALSISAYCDNYNTSLGILEILPAGVCKAAAVSRLRELTGAERLTVFGDNLNDLPLMKIADTAIATANAAEPVKAAADIIIGPNTTDSVALYILGLLAPE